MQKVKKIPQRQCVGCRTKRDKRDLLRIVKTPEGEIVLDTTGKNPAGACTSVPTRSACGRHGSPVGWSVRWRRPSRRRYMMGWRPGWGSNGAYFINDRPCQKGGPCGDR